MINKRSTEAPNLQFEIYFHYKSKIFDLINLKNIRNNTMSYKAQQVNRLTSSNL